jgi:CBS domain-containing protein
MSELLRFEAPACVIDDARAPWRLRKPGYDRRPVRECMTPAPGLIAVSPALSVGKADDLALLHGTRHLLVEERGHVVGIVCRCDLVWPDSADEPVHRRMSPPAWWVRASLPVEETAGLFEQARVGVLPVVDDAVLVGVVSRGDLRRAGYSGRTLGASRCAACHSWHGVRPHPRMPTVEFCLECLAVATGGLEDSELGVGD